MTDIEPVDSEDKKASVWTVVAVVVGAVALLGVPACLSTQSVVGSETTTTVAGAATTSTTLPVTNPTEQPSTTVRGPEENPFIGWWKATDVDGSLLDLRVVFGQRLYYRLIAAYCGNQCRIRLSGDSSCDAIGHP